MKVRVCSHCGKHNLEDAWNCIDCGETLSIKTLMDTESGQLLSVPPIAGYTQLSEISEHFEQDVIETLETNVGVDESIVWGCNVTKLSKTPPFSFGYLLLTSHQLICVRFISDVASAVKRDKVASAVWFLLNPFIFLVKQLFGLGEASTHPWINVGLPVPYPSQPLTPSEKAARGVIANNLENLTSVCLVSHRHKKVLVKSLVVGFGKDSEFTVAFYSPHQAEKAYQLLTTRYSEKTREKEPERAKKRDDQPSRVYLLPLVHYCFNEHEFKDLCLDLGVDHDDLPGMTKASKTIGLVSYFRRRDALDKLVQVCSRLRPKAPWKTPSAARYEPYSLEMLAEFRQKLTDQFEEGELRQICTGLGVDYKRLPGAEQGSIARELTLYLARRERLTELVEICSQRRPDVPWESILYPTPREPNAQ